MSDTDLSRVDAFLANLSSKQQQQPQPQRGNLIFALDATGSRERAWDSAAELQVQMFKEAALLGGIDVQLVYYRGTQGFDAECKASGWVGNPMRLATLMSRICCRAGNTQICRVLDHALREASKRKVDAMAFVGDCFEEKRTHAVTLADRAGAAQGAGVYVPGGPRSGSALGLSSDRGSQWRGLPRVRSGIGQATRLNFLGLLLRSRSAAWWRWRSRARLRQGFCWGKSADPLTSPAPTLDGSPLVACGGKLSRSSPPSGREVKR